MPVPWHAYGIKITGDSQGTAKLSTDLTVLNVNEDAYAKLSKTHGHDNPKFLPGYGV